MGLKAHATPRNENTIENFEQIGIRISYDCVLELESILIQNVCEQFSKKILLYSLKNLEKELPQLELNTI